MANPVSNAEIEDVLSSIRRLVSEEPHNSRRRSEPEEAAADRLVLTPAQRVTITLDQKEAAAPAWAPDPDDRPDLSDLAQAPLADAVEQAAAQAQPDGQTLEERIAGLEAALRQDPDEWEPDGSEDHSGDNTRPISADAGFDMNTAWKGSAPQAKSEAAAEATPANTPSPIAAVPDPEAKDAGDKPDASEEQADNAAAVSLADTEALFEALDEGGSIPTAPAVSKADPEPARESAVSAQGPETQAHDLPDLDSIDAAVSEGAALAASVAQGVDLDIDRSDAGGEGAGSQPSGAVAGDEPVDPVASADPNVIVAAPRQPHPLPGYDLALDLTTIDAVLSEHPDGALSLSGLESESVFADEDSTSEAAETAGEADAEDAVTLFGGDLASTENAEDDAGAESGAEAAHDADAVDDARAQDDAGAHDGAPTTETEGQASPEDTAPEHATHEDVVHEDTAHEPLPQEHADLELETPEFETPEDTTPENTTPEDTASDAETSGSDTLERDTLDDAMSETAEAPKEQDDTEVAGSIADAEAEADAVPAAEMGSFEVEPSETGSDDEAASDEAEVETGDASQNDDKAPEAELSDAPLADEATLGDGAAEQISGVEEGADDAVSGYEAETAEAADTAENAGVDASDAADLAEPSEADVAEPAEEAASGDEIADEVSDEAPNGGARDTEETADATANVIALPEVDTVADALGARAAELSEAAPGIPMPIVPSEPEIAQKATAGETLTTPPPGEPRATDPAPFDDESSFEAVSGIETIADVDLESVSDAVAAALEQEANQALDTELEGFDIADVDAEALVSMGLTPDSVDPVVDEDFAAVDNGEDYPVEDSGEESGESDEPPSVLILENSAAAEGDAATSELEAPQEAPHNTPASASKPDSAAALEAVIAAISEAPSQKPETAAEYDPDLEAAVLDDTDWDAEDTHAHSVAEEEPAAEDQTEHAGAAEGEDAAIAPDHAAPDAEDDASPDPSLFAAPNSISEDALRDLVSQMVRDELQGELGERITRNVRRLVRREIERALTLRDLD